MITGIVLAAGASERMGAPKLLLPYRDGIVLSGTVEAVATSTVDRVVVVTGPEAAGIDKVLDAFDVSVARNADPSRGNMSSLLTAADEDTQAGAFILVAGDLPTIRSAAIDALTDLWEATAPWAAVTTYTDRIAHPFLLSRDAIAELRPRQEEKLLWTALIESADRRVVHVECTHAAPLDVNTPADYQRLVHSAKLD